MHEGCTVCRFGARASNMNIRDGFDSKTAARRNLETAVISLQECECGLEISVQTQSAVG